MTHPSWFGRRHPTSPLGAMPVTEKVKEKDWNGASSLAMGRMADRALIALAREGFFGPNDVALIKQLSTTKQPFVGMVAEGCHDEAERRGEVSLTVETAIKLLFALADAEDATAEGSEHRPDEVLFIGMEIATLDELLTASTTGVLEDAADKRALREAQAAAARDTNRKRAADTARLRDWIVRRAQSILDHGEAPTGRWDAGALADEVFRDWAPVPANDQWAEDRLATKRISYATVKREVKTAWLGGGLRIPSRS